MKFVGLVNSAWDPLVLIKCALYIEEKSTTAAKKKRKTQNVNSQNVNPNRTLIFNYHFKTHQNSQLNTQFGPFDNIKT